MGDTFESRITRQARAFDLDRGREGREAVGDLGAATQDLIQGIAGSAPYLHGLILKESPWLIANLDQPEKAIEDVLANVASLERHVLDDGLREAKRRVALLIAVCDIGGVWTLPQVTGALSRFADAATHAAIRVHVGREIERGKLPGQTPDDIATAGGMVAIAMGKHGAFELNYSSDIDLICLFDETRYEPTDRMEARAAFIRATRKAMASLSENTAEGYVFRTDLRLRPDPSVTPVCFAMDAAERYYESVGRTWERAAYIKARAAAGDIEAGENFITQLRPFVWRKHLDFHAIRETHDMRLKIRAHKGLGGAIRLEGHNMKLGAGGIREIEFFAQTRQLIAGGRDPDLRMRGTVEALSALADKGWVEQATAETLAADYTAHREVEHRLQMLRDAQTHSLPTASEDFERLACLMGVSVEEMRADILKRCERVHALTEDFFAPDEPTQPQIDLPETLRAFTDRWAQYPAFRSERAREIFARLKPDLFKRVTDLDRPEEVMSNLDGFFAGLPAGVQLFSLFEANPQLIDLILDICSTAPHLAAYLSRNAGVLDAVIGGSFFSDWPGAEKLTTLLATALAEPVDYEDKLDTSRRWAKEWHFRIGVHQLRGLIDADEAGRQYSDLARASMAALFPEVVTEFARKHGAPPGKGAMVLGMGSLGAGKLTAASDLDMIVIYDADNVEASDGKRPLGARPYYARLTQALITAVTAQTAEGRLYEVDMRLRPSGKQGPVATSFDSFRSYQREEAWVWEHLALTRAHPVCGAETLLSEVESFRRAIIEAPKDEENVRQETQEMRERLARAKPGEDWDPKNGAGRMMDIELLASAAALLAGSDANSVHDQLDAGLASGWIDEEEHACLAETYRLMWRLQSAARLLSGEKLSPDNLGAGAHKFLCRSTGYDTASELLEGTTASASRAAGYIDRILARPHP